MIAPRLGPPRPSRPLGRPSGALGRLAVLLVGAAVALLAGSAATPVAGAVPADAAPAQAANALDGPRPTCTTSFEGGLRGSLDGFSAVVNSRIRLVGWVVDTNAPAASLVLMAGDANVGTADRPNPAATALEGAGDAHGFDVQIPAGEGSTSATLSVVRPGPVVTPGAPATIMAIVRCTYPELAPAAPVGDANTIDSPFPLSVRVQGWAVDPTDGNARVRIHVYVDGSGTDVGVADRPRPDVAAVYPWAGPDHGFTWAAANVVPGIHRVCAYAINIGAAPAPPREVNPQLGCRQVTVAGPARGAPIGDLNVAVTQGPGAIRVQGWAFDPDEPTAAVSVHAYFFGLPGSGQGVDLGPAVRSRADVAGVYPQAGPRHGFDGFVYGAYGRVQVCLFALDRSGGPASLIGCRAVDVAAPAAEPIGDLNSVESPGPGRITVRGWAIQRSDPSLAVPIHVYVGGPVGMGSGFAVGPADSPRPDVLAALPGTSGDHGFDATVSGLASGQVVVCAYAIGQGDFVGSTPLLGCRVVAVR